MGVTTAILVLSLIITAFYLTTDSGNEFLKNILIDELESVADAGIKVNRLETDLISSVNLSNITIYTNEKNHSTPFISIDEIDLKYNVTTLIFDELRVDHIIVSGLNLNLSRDENGKFNIPELKIEVSKDSHDEIPFSVGHAELRNAFVNYYDKLIPADFSLDGIKFISNISALKESYHFELETEKADLNFFDEPLIIENFNLSGNTDRNFSLFQSEYKTSISGMLISGSLFSKLDSSKGDIHISGNPDKIIGVIADSSSSELFQKQLIADMDFEVLSSGPEPIINFSLDVPNYQLSDIPFSLSLNGIYDSDTIKIVNLNSEVLSGEIAGKGWLLINESFSHSLSLALDDIVINDLFKHESEEYYDKSVVLNISADTKGDFLPLDRINLKSRINLLADTMTILSSEINVEKGNLVIRSDNSLASLDADLIFDSEKFNCSLDLDFPKLSPLLSCIGYEEFDGNIELLSEINGDSNNLNFSTGIHSSGIFYKGHPVLDTLSAAIKGKDQSIEISEGFANGEISNAAVFKDLIGISDMGGGIKYNLNTYTEQIGLKTKLSIELTDPHFQEIKFNQGEIYIELADSRQADVNIDLSTDSLNIAGGGKIDLKSKSGKMGFNISGANLKGDDSVNAEFRMGEANNFAAKVNSEKLEIGPFLKFMPDFLFRGGLLKFDLDLKKEENDLNIELPFQITDLIMDDYLIDDINGSLSFRDLTVGIDSILVQHGLIKSVLDAKIKLSLDENGEYYIDKSDNITGLFSGDSISLSLINSFTDDFISAEGFADFNLKWDGTMYNPNFSGKMNFNNVGVKTKENDYLVSDFNGSINFENKEINSENLTGVLQGSPFDVNLKVKQIDTSSILAKLDIADINNTILDISGRISDDSLNIFANANNFDISSGKPFIKSFHKLEGKLNSQIGIKTDYQSTDMRGSIEISGIHADPDIMNIRINDGYLKARLHPDQIVIDSSYFNFERGSAAVSGSVEFGQDEFNSLNLAFVLSNIKVSEEELLSLTINESEITLISSGEELSLSGNIQLGESIITRELELGDLLQILASKTESVFERADGKASEKPLDLLEMIEYENIVQLYVPDNYKDLKYNIDISNSDSIWLKNNVVDTRLAADLELTGTVSVPILSGRIILQEEGKLLFLDREFQLRKAIIDFSDAYRINPILDVSANTEVTEVEDIEYDPVNYKINMDITGPLDEFQFELVSDPSLETSDILSLLSLGITYQKLQASENMDQILNERSQVLTTRSLSNQMDKYYRKWLGDFIGIDHIGIGGNAFDIEKTRLELSKTWGNRFEVKYSTSIKDVNRQIIEAKYKINKYFFLQGITDQQEESGADLKFQLMFK